MRFLHVSAVLFSVSSATVIKDIPRKTRRHWKDDFKPPVKKAETRGRYDKDEFRSPEWYAQLPRKNEIVPSDIDVNNDETANLAHLTEEMD